VAGVGIYNYLHALCISIGMLVLVPMMKDNYWEMRENLLYIDKSNKLVWLVCTVWCPGCCSIRI
jgi:hypothetical protein